MILYIYPCTVCGAECRSQRLYPPRQRMFCSDECQDAWLAERREWNAMWRRNRKDNAHET